MQNGQPGHFEKNQSNDTGLAPPPNYGIPYQPSSGVSSNGRPNLALETSFTQLQPGAHSVDMYGNLSPYDSPLISATGRPCPGLTLDNGSSYDLPGSAGLSTPYNGNHGAVNQMHSPGNPNMGYPYQTSSLTPVGLGPERFANAMSIHSSTSTSPASSYYAPAWGNDIMMNSEQPLAHSSSVGHLRSTYSPFEVKHGGSFQPGTHSQSATPMYTTPMSTSMPDMASHRAEQADHRSYPNSVTVPISAMSLPPSVPNNHHQHQHHPHDHHQQPTNGGFGDAPEQGQNGLFGLSEMATMAPQEWAEMVS